MFFEGMLDYSAVMAVQNSAVAAERFKQGMGILLFPRFRFQDFYFHMWRFMVRGLETKDSVARIWNRLP